MRSGRHLDIGARIARGAAALLLATGAQWACAHAYPVHQTPGAGASVAAPAQVAIEFDDALEPAFSSIAVTDAAGKPVTAAKAVVDPADRKHLSLAVGGLAPGVYAVAWVAVAVDGHRTQGHYTFTVK
ncbi:copper resistance protein CopC [Burkholderia sp. FERM BP-3421]|uniref:copper resistance protein CopC n=1 Tax=Burkholderia sp. FERM BP-3421 TaxID=1494466 RepID=UPI00236287BB|nr:copper resistance protein CopC [Burkholderia sp. FERM BP-3421]WDD91831.1 copper resistance protein CopC [Burkholderia sp. FERM BP-3421]